MTQAQKIQLEFVNFIPQKYYAEFAFTPDPTDEVPEPTEQLQTIEISLKDFETLVKNRENLEATSIEGVYENYQFKRIYDIASTVETEDGKLKSRQYTITDNGAYIYKIAGSEIVTNKETFEEDFVAHE